MDEIVVKKTPDKIYRTPEGLILWTGIGMAVLLIAVICWLAFVDPSRSKTISLALVAHTFGGRAAGVGICIMDGLSLFWTTIYNFYLEILIVCFTYSGFVLSINNTIKFRWVLNYSVKLMSQADKKKEKIESYGWIGLFLFVMAPLPVTGPVVGSIIGYLMKIGLARNFSAVFSGTFCAIVLWVYCFDFLENHLHIIRYIIFIIVAVVVLSHLKTIKGWIVKAFRKKN